ncbi:MAG: hypothetical protein ABSG68_06650 [Thermoguttaceae bacterium]|jgi:hypothetical protein
MDHIERAEQAECESDHKTRDTLIEAGYSLLEALFDPEEWPTDLQDRAHWMMGRLLTEGSILNTVEKMDSRTVIQLVVDIKLIAADIELARVKGLVRSISKAALSSGHGRW